MSDAMNDPLVPPARPEASLGLHALGRQARRHQISSSALMTLGMAVAVLAAAMLMWAGIVTGSPRAILLLLAAGLLPARMFINRLGAVTLGDGFSTATNSGLRRWLSHWEAALLLLAGGLCAFGSHKDLGAVMGAIAAALILVGGLRGRAPPTRRLYPTMLLALTAAAAAFEPLWGWRGQTLLIGLGVISVVLVAQFFRRRSDAPPPADP